MINIITMMDGYRMMDDPNDHNCRCGTASETGALFEAEVVNHSFSGPVMLHTTNQYM